MKKIANFAREVREIFHQITWPTRESLIQSTIVVIFISVVLSLILGGADFLFVNIFGALAKNKQNFSATPTPVLLATPTSSPTTNPTPTIIKNIKIKK